MPASRAIPDNMQMLTKAEHEAAHGIKRKPKRGRRRRDSRAWSATAAEFIAKIKSGAA